MDYLSLVDTLREVTIPFCLAFGEGLKTLAFDNDINYFGVLMSFFTVCEPFQGR